MGFSLVRRLMLLVCSVWSFRTTQHREANPPEWPDSVKIFSPNDDIRKIQAELTDSWNKNGGQNPYGEPTARYSPHRFWFAFKPGTYKGLNASMGYYVNIAGLGGHPRDVIFSGGSGPHVPCNNLLPQPGQLVTFWRTAERFKRVGSMDWFVSQAAPIRDVIITGDLNLHKAGSHGSGGYLANSIVQRNVNGGGQQQWFTRNVHIGGRWTGVAWNAVFVGCTSAKKEQHVLKSRCATDWQGQTVAVKKTPLVAEKPFISIDPKNKNKFNLNVPQPEKNAVGARFNSPSVVYPFEKVYVTKTSDTVQTMNAKLAAGLHLVITPAIYLFDETLMVTKDDQVVMCIGMASLVSTNGNALITVAPGLGGVRVAGCLLEASPKPTDALLKWGDESSPASPRPSFMHDVIARVGGPAFDGNKGNVAQAKTQLSINSDDVVADHLWLWRGDHYVDQTYNTDSSEHDKIGITKLGELPNPHGLVVTSRRVRIYALAVEHATEDQVVWSGEDGEVYFFQCEIPYEMDSIWANKDFVAYHVTANVKKHKAFGVGAYSYFNLSPTWMKTAFRVPKSIVDTTFVQPFIVKLTGYGGIKSVINGNLGGGLGKWPWSHEKLFYNNASSNSKWCNKAW